jgi:uncharacterized low-complexity protein
MANEKPHTPVFTPLAVALGTSLVLSLSNTPIAHANIFSHKKLMQGYQVADNHSKGSVGEAKCGESTCGDNHATEDNSAAKEQGNNNAKTDKSTEGKCGEGKCGEGKCGS